MLRIAEGRGHAASQVERMVRLYDMLGAFAGDGVMGPRMALVGGTALNADLPRLSVDIDIHYTGGVSARLRRRPDAGSGEVTPEALSVSFPLEVIDNHRNNVNSVWFQAMEGHLLGRHRFRCVGCQDTVEAMGQEPITTVTTVLLEQSETVRGTCGGACCRDKGPISLDVVPVYQTQIQSAYRHRDRVACRRWCRASEPTGVGFGIPVSDDQEATMAAGDSGPIADLNPLTLRLCHHWQGEGEGHQQGGEGRQSPRGGGGGVMRSVRNSFIPVILSVCCSRPAPWRGRRI